MGRALAIVAEFERAHGEVVAFAEACSESEWIAQCPEEGWPVAAGVNHIADGYETALEWTASYLANRPVALTRAQTDQRNAEKAAINAQRGREETLEILERRGGLARQVLADLSDEELEIAFPFGLADDREISLEQLGGILIRHTSRHLTSCQAAVSAASGG